MIFSQYRESVYEITEMLSSHPEIKPMEFVGQSAGGSRKSVTQKEQLEVKVYSNFRNKINYPKTLIFNPGRKSELVHFSPCLKLIKVPGAKGSF